MKYALVTGASGGIGREIARSLAKQGFGLYLHYNRNEHDIAELIKELGEVTEVHKIQSDFAKKDGIKKIVAAISTPVDCVILNSGSSHIGLITDMTDEEVENFVQLHITSPFLLTKALLPNMIRKRSGCIIAVSSIWGLTGASCEVLYSMVKGGLNTFVKALAKEVALSGVRVNGVAPGAINTNMLRDFEEKEIEQLCEEIPMGRLGEPHEVADLISFLLSDQASYISGQIISVNGAWYC